jgi:hypothetical protein
LDDFNWQKQYAALVEYGKEHGNCNIPVMASYECELPGYGPNGESLHYKGRLGKWLTTQRQSKKGNGYKLTIEREALLQKLVDEGKIFS